MRYRLAVTLLVLLATVESSAHDSCGKAACAAVKAEIREVEAKLRGGYTRAQGERHEARLRKLKARRSRLCR